MLRRSVFGRPVDQWRSRLGGPAATAPARRGLFRPWSADASSSDDSSATTAHRHSHQAILHRVHPRHLYGIINDVDSYRDFLPLCSESRVLRTSDCGTMYDAVLAVGLPGLSQAAGTVLEERYVSRVRATETPGSGGRPTWTVEAKSVRSNLFDSLRSRWELSLVDDIYRGINVVSHGTTKGDDVGRDRTGGAGSSCRVNFEVEIGVSNPLISFTLDQVLREVAKRQVEAFERRCRELPFDETAR